ESLDSCDLLACGIRHTFHAGANGLAIKMDRASSAEGHAAAILGAGETKRFAQYPQQRRIGIYVRIELFAVNFESDHDFRPSCPALHELLSFECWTNPKARTMKL